MRATRRDGRETGNQTLGRSTQTARATRRRSAAFALVILAAILAGCSGAGVGPTSEQPSVGLTIDEFRDGTADVTVSIVDAASLVPLYNETYLSQATPFSANYPLSSASVLVTVTISLNLDPSARIYSGTNAGPLGTTLTDPGIDFTHFLPPLFVVNYVGAPPTRADVQTITDPNHLALSSAFPAGPYSLFASRAVSARITYTNLGTSVLPLQMWDNTPAAYSVSTRF